MLSITISMFDILCHWKPEGQVRTPFTTEISRVGQAFQPDIPGTESGWKA
jgi:hypothetical protein